MQRTSTESDTSSCRCSWPRGSTHDPSSGAGSVLKLARPNPRQGGSGRTCRAGEQRTRGARPGAGSHADPEQVVDGDLEQLVARVGLEDLHERLLVVAAGGERGAPEHRVDLAPQDRYRVRARVVGVVGEQAEEAPLADHPAVLVEALDADVVEEGRPVNRRARVRLGEVEQVWLERVERTAAECCQPRRSPRPRCAGCRARSPAPTGARGGARRRSS